MQKTGHVSVRCCQNPFRIDLRSLGCFRIAIALLLIYDVFFQGLDLSALYLDGGALPAETVSAYHQGTGSWSLHLLWASPAWQWILLFARLGAGVALVVGFRSQLSAAVAWLLTVSMQTRAPMLVSGGDVLLAMMLFWSILLPVGAHFSLDARRRGTPAPGESVLSLASVGVMLQIVIMYWYTALSKWNPAWLGGDALETILSGGMLTRPLGNLLLSMPLLLKLLTWGTLLWELVGPLLLLSPWKTRWLRPIGLVGFVLLHIGIELSINVLIFSFSSLAALLLFLPASTWSRVDGGRPAVEPGRAEGTGPGQLGRLPSALAASCIVLVLVYNVIGLTVTGQGPGWAVTVRRMVRMAHWNQRWNMFDQPEGLVYRFVARGRLAGGRTLDLNRGTPLSAEGMLTRPEDPIQISTSRRILLIREMVRNDNFIFRQQVAEWLVKKWNAEHRGSDQLLELEWMVFIGPMDQPPLDPELLAYVDARAHGGYRYGMRDGHWILRHDNGDKAAEGDYRLGREEGDWTFWDEQGKRTNMGGFRDGLQHGNWTYYFSGGRETVVHYEDGRVVEESP